MRPAFILILLLTACAPGDRDHGRQVFRYNEGEGITSLDPAFARNLEHMWVVDQLFDGLVEMDGGMRVVPGVAGSWSVEDSARQYRFQLRRDVFFHDHPAFPEGRGRRVVAADVAYSLERIRDPRTASPGRWVLDVVLPGREGIRVLDDSTLLIRLVRPFPPFLSMLAMPYCSVVPREVVEGLGGAWRSGPVGCGPFRFFHWLEGVSLVLHRHDRYHQRDEQGGRLPYLDAVVVSFVKDPNAEFLALVKGELDMISGTEGGMLSALLDPLGSIKERYADRITMERAPALATDYFGFLLDSSAQGMDAWRDPRLRQALSYALDRERLVNHILHGIGRPAGGIVPPSLPGARGGQRFDPVRARALLTEAGHPQGRGLPPLVLSTTAGYLELCEFVQHEWAAFGIPLRVDVVPLSTHKEGTANGEFRFFRKNWIADYPDAENFLLLFHSANRAPVGPNYTRHSDPVFDAWYEQALVTPDEKHREALYTRMDSMLAERAPAVFVQHPEVVRFIRAGVTGLRADPMNMLDLRTVRIPPR